MLEEMRLIHPIRVSLKDKRTVGEVWENGVANSVVVANQVPFGEPIRRPVDLVEIT